MRRLLGLLVVALVPASASADVVSQRDRDGVAPDLAERLGLTKAERRALDVGSVQVIGHEGLGAVVDVRFKGDVPRVRPVPGALRRVRVTLHPVPDRVESRSALVRTGSSVKLLFRGPGFAGLERVEVTSLVGSRRAGGAAVAADGLELFLDPADTTPRRLECLEMQPLYQDLTDAITALTVRRFRMEEEAPDSPALRRVRASLGLAFTLGGEAEVRYPRSC